MRGEVSTGLEDATGTGKVEVVRVKRRAALFLLRGRFFRHIICSGQHAHPSSANTRLTAVTAVTWGGCRGRAHRQDLGRRDLFLCCRRQSDIISWLSRGKHPFRPYSRVVALVACPWQWAGKERQRDREEERERARERRAGTKRSTALSPLWAGEITSSSFSAALAPVFLGPHECHKTASVESHTVHNWQHKGYIPRCILLFLFFPRHLTFLRPAMVCSPGLAPLSRASDVTRLCRSYTTCSAACGPFWILMEVCLRWACQTHTAGPAGTARRPHGSPPGCKDCTTASPTRMYRRPRKTR